MTLPQFLYPFTTIAQAANPGIVPLTPSGGAAPGTDSLPGFLMQPQQQTNWCWAAVSASVAAFFNSNKWSQCLIAAAELGPLKCCGSDASGPCNIPWYLDAALKRVNHFDKITGVAELFTTLQSEIAGRRPLCCHISWIGGGAHFVALGGWSVAADGTEWVDVHDPFYGRLLVTYSDFCNAYQKPGDDWDFSYFTLNPPAPMAGGAAPTAISPTNA